LYRCCLGREGVESDQGEKKAELVPHEGKKEDTRASSGLSQPPLGDVGEKKRRDILRRFLGKKKG